MWHQLQEVQAAALGGVIPAEEVLAEVCRAVLRCGAWRLARGLLGESGARAREPGPGPHLTSEAAATLVVEAGREFFYAANSLDAPELGQACLLLWLCSDQCMRKSTDAKGYIYTA